MGLTVLGPDIGVASESREWHDGHWDLVYGCTKVSPGCERCTAEHMFARHWGLPGYAEKTSNGQRWTGRVETQPKALTSLDCLKPKRLLTCAISDLFHEEVPDQFLDQAFEAMGGYTQHRFAVLTKRSKRMRDYLRGRQLPGNIWPGVTIENRKYKQRARDLLEINAELRWVSAEPLLEDLGDLSEILGPDRISFIAAGPELGDGRRPCDAAWMRSLRDQCHDHGAQFFTKHILDGQTYRDCPPI